LTRAKVVGLNQHAHNLTTTTFWFSMYKYFNTYWFLVIFQYYNLFGSQ